jgi:acyl-lipid omega-6 desaturase (Delta-12 desaturase)
MTHDEYKNASFLKRARYDFTRNPVARVLIVPINAYILYKIPFWFYSRKIIINSAIATTIYAFLIYGLGTLVSFQGLIFIFAIPMFFTHMMMTSVFILQHKFEKAVWYDEAEWDHFEVALHGSSYIKFGKFMDWFSGGIGYHHIHHLNPKIPFYNLRKSEKSVREVVAVDPIYLSAYFRHMKAKVWDDGEGKMVEPQK